MRDALTMKLSLLLAASVALSVGCAVPSGEGDEPGVEMTEAALGEAGTLTFEAGHRQRLTGTLQKGKKVRVVYEPSRLSQCRGEQSGRPAWTITGYWRIGDGPVRTFEAGGHSPSGGAAPPVLSLDVSGELQLWFENTNRWGCRAFDSALGDNYRFAVSPAEHEPGWIGNTRYALDRLTCGGGPCDRSLSPMPAEITYGTYARQRAAVRTINFEVWKDGVTSWDNPDLWRHLDVQVHSRVGGVGPFSSRYVSFDRRLGDNARYGIDLARLDPIPGLATVQRPADCPAVPIENDGPGLVSATVELYFTVNGVEHRPEGGGAWRVRYVNYAGLFTPCL
jgi:hypothetical protein